MSRLRPTLRPTREPGLEYESTYFRVLEAVMNRRGLIHGKLENGQGRCCPIGAYFKESAIPISTRAIDEIVAYNDSFPHLGQRQRWHKVLAWLRFTVKRLNK